MHYSSLLSCEKTGCFTGAGLFVDKGAKELRLFAKGERQFRISQNRK